MHTDSHGRALRELGPPAHHLLRAHRHADPSEASGLPAPRTFTLVTTVIKAVLRQCALQGAPWSWKTDTCRGPSPSVLPVLLNQPGICSALSCLSFLLSSVLYSPFFSLSPFSLLCYSLLFLYSCLPSSSSGFHHQSLPIAHAPGTCSVVGYFLLTPEPGILSSEASCSDPVVRILV